jgi:hypothetical protein
VMYVMASTGSRITAKRIQRETGVTYKTAWRTLRQLRQVIVNEELRPAHSTKQIDVPNDLSVPQEHGLSTALQRECDITTGMPAWGLYLVESIKWRKSSGQEDFRAGLAEGVLTASFRIARNAARRIGPIFGRVFLRGGAFFVARFIHLI